MPSPSGNLTAVVRVEGGRAVWSLQRRDTVIIEPSPLGIRVSGADHGALVHTLREAGAGSVREVYPWRGGKAWATNHCQTYRLGLDAPAGAWALEARVFDDGFAYRYRVPGSGVRRVEAEASTWTLPAGGTAWVQTNTGDYEGAYHPVAVESFPREERTEQGRREVHLGPPVTVKLKEGGYVLVSEAGLFNYSGMSLRSTGDRRLRAVFEDDPGGFEVEGEVVSPWRVTLVVDDLNGLVNSDVIPGLCEPPDPALFPGGMRTAWIRPGRALITWCVFGNEGARWHLQKWFVDQCAALKCEYLLVDAGWRTERWGWLAGGGDVWARLRELCEYGRTRGVDIVVWHAYPEGRDDGPGLTRPEARRELMEKVAAAGAKGGKIDFFNSEKAEVIRVQGEMTRLAAERRLLINFHGAHKPTGEARTWPNEITREGIREQEYLLWDSLPLEHYSALPFTRLAAGHADFLPTYVRSRFLRNTTATFQMATAVLATSGFVCWPDHPDDYRASVFLGLVQAIPGVWDETRVLPGSEMGGVVGIARRSGSEWFVGVINGAADARSWSAGLEFLGEGAFTATRYRDEAPHPAGVRVEVDEAMTAGNRVTAELRPGGGWVGWFRPRQVP